MFSRQAVGPPVLVLSCEHATAAVPRAFRHLFAGHPAVLHSHRGWDPGTWQLGRGLAARFDLPLPATEVSRLLIEVNRSLHHPRLFSEFSQPLSGETKQALIERYYLPYRQQVESLVVQGLRQGHWVWHVSLHSFTGQWNGQPRTADLGLLYDPARKREQWWCQAWQRQLAAQLPDLRIRRNYPYLGKADGLTTALRRRFPADQYLGVELEVNQRWIEPSSSTWRRIRSAVATTIERMMASKF